MIMILWYLVLVAIVLNQEKIFDISGVAVVHIQSDIPVPGIECGMCGVKVVVWGQLTSSLLTGEGEPSATDTANSFYPSISCFTSSLLYCESWHIWHFYRNTNHIFEGESAKSWSLIVGKSDQQAGVMNENVIITPSAWFGWCNFLRNFIWLQSACGVQLIKL